MMKFTIPAAALIASARSCALCSVDPNSPVNVDRPLLWSDEFATNTLDTSKWVYDVWPAYFVNGELQQYMESDANVYQQSGSLFLRLIQREEARYDSGRIKSRAFTEYGRVEVRAKLPTSRGAWPAIWMLPTDPYDWPDCGEIDIMEHASCNMGDVFSTVHTGAYNHIIETQKGETVAGVNVGEWHTYSIDWDASHVSFSIDGAEPHFSFSNDNAGDEATWPFSQPFRLIMNIALGGNFGNTCLAEGENPVFPDDGNNAMEVDYARVYGLEYCSGPYPQHAECEDRIQWMLANWDATPAQRDAYLAAGLADGSRCAIQQYLDEVEGFCPEICTGDFQGFPECGPAIDWMKDNWDATTESRNNYLNLGLEDGSSCAIQKYLHDHEEICPDIDLSFRALQPAVLPTPAPTSFAQSCSEGSTVWNTVASGQTCGARINNGISAWGLTFQESKNRVGTIFPECAVCRGENEFEPCEDGERIWNTPVDGIASSCGARIQWVMRELGATKAAAQNQLAAEYAACGACTRN